MPSKYPCEDCGKPCHGKTCRPCRSKRRREVARKSYRSCIVCGETLHRGTKGELCGAHRLYGKQSISAVLTEESKVAPSLEPVPKKFGDWLIVSDTHIPFHHTETLTRAVRDAMLLGIKQLCIAGDIIHADIISKYVGAGKQVELIDELASAGRVLGALESYFDTIQLIVGNHDQRVEKLVASWTDTKAGQNALNLLARIQGVPDDPEAVAGAVFEHFFGSPKVRVHPLPDLLINDTWLVLHPGSAARIPGNNERRLVVKHRKPVLAGHNHLFGIQFDESGVDVGANIGHCCDDEKFRYMRERPTHFPKTVHGYVAILCDDEVPEGRLLPLANHRRWFDLESLSRRLNEAN